ncbi:MAG: alpha-hydroxy-acid oxidizing protein, partial [Gemmatimonadales bacterium]|nr:alpha-hydroxy-acid oxidizing protein [Gemmatimonadales bacterium]
GGRVLDTVPASIDALPAVAAAVGDRVPVLVDGGIRRGTDVVKAIALGASAVLIGRPFMHGLAAAGALGVVHVLHMLRTELEMAMVLCGRKTLAELDPSVVSLQWRPAARSH